MDESNTTDEASKAEIAMLVHYYEHAMTRMLHEYDQRDRDFAMHITINAGIFAAVGFVTQMVKLNSPSSWVISGIGITLLGFLGYQVSSALLESVKSYEYWQKLLQKTLCRLEKRFLSNSVQGIYKQVVSRNHKPEGSDLVDSRKKMATAILTVWKIIFLLAELTLIFGLFGIFCPKSHKIVMNFLGPMI